MTKQPGPKCPRCGSHDGKLLSTKDGYLNNPPEEGEQPISTASVYLCSCGETFTHTVQHRPSGIDSRN